MTDTEKAALERRIDELCAEVEKYKSARDASVDLATKTIDRINELEAEVERLKGKLSESYDESHVLEVENLKLYNENFELQQHLEAEQQRNDKLRELARGLRHCAELRDCEDCPLYDLTEPEHCRSARLEKALGIEVGK